MSTPDPSFTSGGQSFAKLDEELRTVWGWSSVVTEKGVPVVDLQGDVIGIDVLQKAVWDFMDSERVSATMHGRDKSGKPVRTGKIVDSFVITSDIAKALGMDPGREGWLVGVKVEDDAVWQDVKNGTYKMFSIGGMAVFYDDEELDDDDEESDDGMDTEDEADD